MYCKLLPRPIEGVVEKTKFEIYLWKRTLGENKIIVCMEIGNKGQTRRNRVKFQFLKAFLEARSTELEVGT